MAVTNFDEYRDVYVVADTIDDVASRYVRIDRSGSPHC